MKKWFILCVILSLCLVLTGCGQEAPARAADGAAWDESWTMAGGILGVEEPGDGLRLLDNMDILAVSDMYYAAWSIGDPISYTDADGDEAVMYDAQLFLLTSGASSAEEAQKALDSWRAQEAENYTVTETASAVYNGQAFTLVRYQWASETNPYARGVSAFGVYKNYAVCAELSCREGFDGDEADILARFLEGCHYAA